MRAETLKFAKEKYFNGYSDTRTVQENFNLITSFTWILEEKLIFLPPKMLKKQLIKDWCAQSWNMEALCGILILNASRRNWRRYTIVPLDL